MSSMMWRSAKRFTPPADMIELADRLVVMVEVAGMKPDDFDISLANRKLTISGVRSRQSFNDPAYHQVEIGYGEFRIEIKVPYSVDPSSVSATYNDGFLRIEMPRSTEKQVRVVHSKGKTS